MSYIDNTLLAQEHVIYRTRTHWIIFLTAIFWFIVSIVLLTQHKLIALIGLVTLILGAFDFVHSFIRYISSEYAVTNKRVLVKLGFIRRQSLETFLQKVEGIQVDQTIMGRLFNYGIITIIGTGGTRDRYSLIADPLSLRHQVQNQIEIVLTSKDTNA